MPEEEVVVNSRGMREWLDRFEEPVRVKNAYGRIMGTWIPAGREPPQSPPEPPFSSATVGRPPKPGAGGPGAAVIPLAEIDETLDTPTWRLIESVEKGRI